MSVTAGNVMDGSAALLTDPDKITFTYTVLLPYLKIAWDELQEALVENGIVDVDEISSTPQTITTGTKEWVGPTDMIFPVRMWERAVGGSDEDWEEMDNEEAEPWETQVQELEKWWYSEGTLKFRGATSDRQVIVRYQREIASITSESTVLPVTNVKSFLTFRTAAITARARGNNSRADNLDTTAGAKFDQLIGAKVKDEQGMPVRPRRYGYSRRSRYRVT